MNSVSNDRFKEETQDEFCGNWHFRLQFPATIYTQDFEEHRALLQSEHGVSAKSFNSSQSGTFEPDYAYHTLTTNEEALHSQLLTFGCDQDHRQRNVATGYQEGWQNLVTAVPGCSLQDSWKLGSSVASRCKYDLNKLQAAPQQCQSTYNFVCCANDCRQEAEWRSSSNLAELPTGSGYSWPAFCGPRTVQVSASPARAACADRSYAAYYHAENWYGLATAPAIPTGYPQETQKNPYANLAPAEARNYPGCHLLSAASPSGSTPWTDKKRPASASTLPQRANVCSICRKTYARPSTLKTHMRTHNGERPFKCQLCPKAFSQAANLTAHNRIHSGDKPFKCPICSRRFSQSSSVTTHMRTHSGERPYKCESCKKTFSDNSTLTKHRRTHTGERPYICPVCFMPFSQSGNLNRHRKMHLNC